MHHAVPPRLLTILAALTALPTAHGGWAVVTVQDLPDQIIVGRPLTLSYTVRQHGRTLLSGLRGRVSAAAGDATISAAASPGPGPGRYQATLTLPRTGTWSITVSSGFGTSDVTLLPIPAVNPGASAPVAAAAEAGRRLFVAKGCVTCHLHPAMAQSGVVRVGPDLGALRLEPEFLRRFLADPSILPPDARGQQMPNLGLSASEIAALATFVNGAPEDVAGQ